MKLRPLLVGAFVVYLGVAVPYTLAHQHTAAAVVAPAASSAAAYQCPACTSTSPAAPAAAVEDYAPMVHFATPVQRQAPSYSPSFSAPQQEPNPAPYVDNWYETNQRQLAAAKAYNDDQRLRALEQAQRAQQQQADFCRYSPKGYGC